MAPENVETGEEEVKPLEDMDDIAIYTSTLTSEQMEKAHSDANLSEGIFILFKGIKGVNFNI